MSDDNATIDPLSNTAAEKLKGLIHRIESLEEDKAVVQTDLKEVYAEAKGEGFDTKALRALIRRRKQDVAKREEFEAIVELYESVVWTA